jgi:hypothetical protein
MPLFITFFEGGLDDEEEEEEGNKSLLVTGFNIGLPWVRRDCDEIDWKFLFMILMYLPSSFLSNRIFLRNLSK